MVHSQHNNTNRSKEDKLYYIFVCNAHVHKSVHVCARIKLVSIINKKKKLKREIDEKV